MCLPRESRQLLSGFFSMFIFHYWYYEKAARTFLSVILNLAKRPIGISTCLLVLTLAADYCWLSRAYLQQPPPLLLSYS
jgi:hypothetical protein